MDDVCVSYTMIQLVREEIFHVCCRFGKCSNIFCAAKADSQTLTSLIPHSNRQVVCTALYTGLLAFELIISPSALIVSLRDKYIGQVCLCKSGYLSIFN